MRLLLAALAALALPGLAVAAKGTVSLDRVGVVSPPGKVSTSNPVRVYTPRTGGPTFEIRVPRGRVIRDASFNFVTPTRSTRSSDVYTLSRGLFMNLGTKSWDETKTGELVWIK